MKNPGFDPAKDFVPVAGFATFVNAVALSGGTPARDLKAWIDSVKAAGGKSTVGIPAPASTPQFAVQFIGKQYGLDLVAAPYRGSAPMMADMLGNQIPAGVGSVPDFIENHKAGKLRVVAVMGTQRQAALPDVPTFTELGIKGFEDVPYYGLFAPAGTPAAALDKLSAALQKVIAMPDVREKLSAMGLTVGHMSGAELGRREATYREVWARIIKDSGYQPQ
jgi:tripartite-type tricarboxylate transporter receptor subunit TctC